MVELLKCQIDGSFGCAIEATPATIYEQFENIYTASLFYDFVIVDELNHCIDLHTDGPHSKPFLRENFERLKSSGIAIDPCDAFKLPEREMNIKEFNDTYLISADKSPSDRLKLNFLMRDAADAHDNRLSFLYSISKPQGKTLADSITIPPEKIDEHQNLMFNLNEKTRSLRNFMHELVATNCGFNLDSGQLLVRGYDRNAELRELLNEGRVPLGGRPSETRPLTSGDELRTLQLVLRDVPFPSGIPLDEFIEYRNSKIVRKSVRAFRKLASDLVEGQSPARYIVQEIVDQYETYKAETQIADKKAQISNIKFVISNIAGAIEDVLKLRLESFAKRPFEMSEYVLDIKSVRKEYENSPFYFLYEKDMSVPRLESNFHKRS